MLTFTDGQEAKVVGFRIYYGDGSTVSGTNSGEWDTAPGEDVQCVLVFYDRTYQCHTRQELETFNYLENFCLADYYWFSSSLGFGRTPPDFIPSDAIVKHGRWLEPEDFRKIYNVALQDRRWR